MRRNLLNLALAVALVPSAIYLVLRRMPDQLQTTAGFPGYKHRVAVALAEAFRAELTSVAEGQIAFAQAFTIPFGGPPVTMDNYRIPKDLNAFWYREVDATPAGMWSLQAYSIEGVARDGRTIKATIEDDPLGLGSVVDFHGDAEAARDFAPRIAEILAHPRFKHESPEDRAALMAFFKRSGNQPKIIFNTGTPMYVANSSISPVYVATVPSIPPAIAPPTSNPSPDGSGQPAAPPETDPEAIVPPPPAKEAGPPGA